MFRMELENIVANTVYIKARAGKLVIDLNVLLFDFISLIAY